MDRNKVMITTDICDTENIGVVDFAPQHQSRKNRSMRECILAVVWDSLDKTPEERKFIANLIGGS
jgi:hypothetical protein